MNISERLIESWGFQLFTWATITSALVINILAYVASRRDGIFGRLRYHHFISVSFMSAFWMVSYTLYAIDYISRQQYLNLVSPIAPVAFLVVWVLPPLSYYLQAKKRANK